MGDRTAPLPFPSYVKELFNSNGSRLSFNSEFLFLDFFERVSSDSDKLSLSSSDDEDPRHIFTGVFASNLDLVLTVLRIGGTKGGRWNS